MRQVPFEKFLILGLGRLGRHLQNYLTLLHLPLTTWTRSEGEAALAAKVRDASHILLCLRDDVLAPFFEKHREQWLGKQLLHFSGGLSLPDVPSAHPLMTFSNSLYDLATYQSVPFIVEKGRGELAELLPGLSNPSYSIASEQKPLYHALCVMSGNFTILLWENFFRELEVLGLPRRVAGPYLAQVSRNLLQMAPESVLTGPLARGDQAVINRHLEALGDSPWQKVYASFVETQPGGQA